jgi:hypothetical protein
LLVAAVVVFLGLLIFRNVCPSKWRWWYFVIPVLIAGAGFGIDWLVQTDREKIKTVLNIAVKAVEQENPKALAAVISDNYRDSLCSSKEALINSFQSRFAEPLVDKIIARIISLEISSPLTSATVIFTARVLFDPRSSVYDFKREVFAKVELNLRKKTGRWLITQAELLELDLRPVSWRDIEQADW